MQANVQKHRSDNWFTDNPYESKGKSLMDLSYDHKTTFSMGQLIPALIVETMPGDEFKKLSMDIMMRFEKLFLPIMHRVDVRTEMFYVPWNLIWSNWQNFIMNKTSHVMPTARQSTHPWEILGVAKRERWIAEYMGFPILEGGSLFDDDDEYVINCGAIAAYNKIWNEWYRRPQHQNEIFSDLNDGDNTDDLLQDAASNYMIVQYRNWNFDYFTSALIKPNIGADITLPVWDEDYLSEDDNNIKGPFRWRRRSNDLPVGTGGLVIDNVEEDGATGVDTTGAPLVYLDTQEGAGTIRELRYRSILLSFLERLMKAGLRYRDYLKNVFRTDPNPLQIDVPVMLSSHIGKVIISEVLATASQFVDGDPDNTTSLGQYAGQALSLEGTPNTQYTCSEHGFIIGMLSVVPRSSYQNGIPKMFLRKTYLDYPIDMFSAIGDQEIQDKELSLKLVDNSVIENDRTWGYIGRYADWKWHNDIVSAEMRNLWKSFHLGRIFDQREDADPLNGEFLKCKPRVDDVFQIKGGAQAHEIFAHVYNTIEVLRGLQKNPPPML